jgi:hypothetical protein
MLKTFSGDGAVSSALAGLEQRLAGRVPDDAAVPSPVRMAVRLMLTAAAITLVAGLFSVIALLADPQLLFNNGTRPTSSQLTSSIVSGLVSTVISVAIWIVMARMNRGGHWWARIVASALFALATLLVYAGTGSLQGGAVVMTLNIITFVFLVAEWLCGLAALALLWRGESSRYYRQRAADR